MFSHNPTSRSHFNSVSVILHLFRVSIKRQKTLSCIPMLMYVIIRAFSLRWTISVPPLRIRDEVMACVVMSSQTRLKILCGKHLIAFTTTSGIRSDFGQGFMTTKPSIHFFKSWAERISWVLYESPWVDSIFPQFHLTSPFYHSFHAYCLVKCFMKWLTNKILSSLKRCVIKSPFLHWQTGE